MTESAQFEFEEARRALAALDFGLATQHAQKAEQLVSGSIRVVDHLAPAAPIYSIIVVLYQRAPDLREAIRRLARYDDDDKFEIILVNNSDFHLDDILSLGIRRCRWLDVGFNYGCTGGRNLGARQARGDYLIFLDDDGLVDDQAVENLVETITKHDALAVRGRIRPKSPSLPKAPPHYDLGDQVVSSGPNTEGISIWRRDTFLEAGAFDTLLAGGEGWALWSIMCKTYGLKDFGLNDFLYTPDAVLFHDYADSLEHFQQKKSKYSPNAKYFRYAYPDVPRQSRDFEIECVRRALKHEPDSVELKLRLGTLLQERRKVDQVEAADAFRQAIAARPNFAEAHRRLSLLYAGQNRLDEALAASRHAVECDPEDAQSQSQRGNVLKKAGRIEEAKTAFLKAIALRPNLATPHLQLSTIFAKDDRLEEALAAARRAVEADPDDAPSLYNLGNLLRRVGRLEDAETAYRQAIAVRPELAKAHRQLSVLLASQNRQSEALAAAQRGVEFNPEDADSLSHLGNLLKKAGRHEEAETAFRRARER